MRRLTLRQFRVFEAVARHLSFSRAAEELHLSQPAVSMQVKGIEAILGMPLTEQLGKKIFLTEAGREVLHASQAITARLDDLQANLAQLRGMDSGQLNIAVTTTVSAVATDILARFRGKYPKVAIHLDVSNRESVRCWDSWQPTASIWPSWARCRTAWIWKPRASWTTRWS